MTSAMGAPVDEFYEDWSRRHRKMLQDPNTPHRLKLELEAAMEQYHP